MNLTTLLRVNGKLGKDTTTDDVVMSRVIESVSSAAEAMMRRQVQETERTVRFSLRSPVSFICLPAYPIVSVSEIHNDPARDYDSGTVVPSDDYYVDNDAGTINFDYRLATGPGALQVKWTGGLGTSVDDVIVNGFADIVEAVEAQVVFNFQRRQTPHLQTHSGPANTGATFETAVNWIPWVRDVLERHRNNSHAG